MLFCQVRRKALQLLGRYFGDQLEGDFPGPLAGTRLRWWSAFNRRAGLDRGCRRRGAVCVFFHVAAVIGLPGVVHHTHTPTRSDSTLTPSPQTEFRTKFNRERDRAARG
jgi:hypothetical protein